MDTAIPAEIPAEHPRRLTSLLIVVVAGAVAALTIGTYGRIHDPTGQGIVTFGFPAVLPMKAWFTTGALALVVVQVLTSLRMWDRITIPRRKPAWLATAHRWSGTAAFVLTLPAAYHCLWALGFQTTTPRVLVHSLLGCAFYGAFTAKMLALRSPRLLSWALPALGGAVAVALTGLWLTSSLWFFTTFGFPGI